MFSYYRMWCVTLRMGPATLCFIVLVFSYYRMCSLIIECVLLTNVVCDTQNGTGDALLHCSSRHQVAAKSGYPTFFFCIICFFALFVFLHCFCVVLVDTKLLRNLVIRFLFFAVLDCSRGRQVVTKFATTAKETYIHAAKETCIYAAKETYLYRKRDLH